MPGIVSCTLIGALAGLTYGTVKKGTLFYGVVVLDPKPEAFFMDNDASDIFRNITQFRKISHQANTFYLEAFQATDSLLYLEFTLQTQSPKFDDTSFANSCIETAIKSINKLENLIYPGISLAKFQIKKEKLKKLLEKHRINIESQCQHIPIPENIRKQLLLKLKI